MSFLFSWFRNLFNLFSRKKATIILSGLDNAGKSTLLHLLATGKVALLPPTNYPNKDAIVIGSTTLSAHDMGGHAVARRLWKQYMLTANGIVFIVDSTDADRFEESAQELAKILADPELARVPLLILGNKIDLRNAVSEQVLEKALKIEDARSGKEKGTGKPAEGAQRPVELFMCSVVKRTGYMDGLQWLVSHV